MIRSVLPATWRQIGPTPASSVLIIATAIAIFLADYLAVWLASGQVQLVPDWSRSDRGTYLLIQVTTFAGLLLALVCPHAVPGLHIPGPVVVPVALGAIAAWSGIALRTWATLTLGRSFRRTVTVTDHQAVVTTVPYRYLRHPAYSGILLAFAGLGAMFANWGSLVCLAVLPAFGYVARIRVEEQALERSLGSAYADYARDRRRLIPGVW
jgi:protein-S-isoprenylcysteine O-methyltransferase Ste14